MPMNLEVQLTGPLFTGQAARVTEAFIDEAVVEIAAEGVDLVLARLAQVLRNPTGYYESQIQTERVQRDRAVTDGGVIYGPWLEGVGSRNRTTRFKGYSTFRRTQQDLQARVPEIADELFQRKYSGRLQ